MSEMKSLSALVIAFVLSSCVENNTQQAENGPPADFKFGFKENAVSVVKELGLTAADDIGTVGYVVGAVAVPEEWKSGHVYGKWCGAGVPEDKIAVAFSELLTKPDAPISKYLMSFKPVDSLDRRCMLHDICYSLVDSGSVLASHQDCDQDLHNGIEVDIQNGSISVGSYPIAAKILSWVGGSFATTNIQIGAEARQQISYPMQHHAPRVLENYVLQSGGDISIFLARLK